MHWAVAFCMPSVTLHWFFVFLLPLLLPKDPHILFKSRKSHHKHLAWCPPPHSNQLFSYVPRWRPTQCHIKTCWSRNVSAGQCYWVPQCLHIASTVHGSRANYMEKNCVEAWILHTWMGGTYTHRSPAISPPQFRPQEQKNLFCLNASRECCLPEQLPILYDNWMKLIFSRFYLTALNW